MVAIETVHLTKIYKKQHLGKVSRSLGIEDVSLTVKPGEIFGLLGLNGSGKTTTIKLLLDLLRPTSGTVSIFGQPPSARSTLKKIGYLPEVPYFYRYLTAEEILSFYARLSELDRIKERVAEILDVVGLSSRANKRLAEFSKGMLQRIGLAQSLLHDPEILIYDEPLSGLDPLAIQEMRSLILHLRSRGKTVFLSSHLISEIEQLCDRVAILSRGRLVRTLEQKDWIGKERELERIFVADVADSSGMGRIRLQGTEEPA